jgi:hypothetical protein
MGKGFRILTLSVCRVLQVYFYEKNNRREALEIALTWVISSGTLAKQVTKLGSLSPYSRSIEFAV